MEDNWSACLQTLEGHRGGVSSVAFSPDSKHLASASYDKTVKIWDRAIGHCIQTLEIGRPLSYIQFDRAGAGFRLYTEIGAFDIVLPSTSLLVPLSASPPSLPAPPAQEPHHTVPRHGYGVSADDIWITYNDENLLWLLSEYRPSTSAVAASTVALGCMSGRVLLWTFAFLDKDSR
jgi:WD40 repeat protein